MSNDPWQPIETAPEDGTVILGYEPDGYEAAMPMVFDKKRKCFVFCHMKYAQIFPTHWMPHPELPPNE